NYNSHHLIRQSFVFKDCQMEVKLTKIPPKYFLQSSNNPYPQISYVCPMQHPLDNPIFNALISNNKYLSNGNEQAKHFADDVAPFVGLKDNSDDDFKQLYELLPYDCQGVFIKH